VQVGLGVRLRAGLGERFAGRLDAAFGLGQRPGSAACHLDQFGGVCDGGLIEGVFALVEPGQVTGEVLLELGAGASAQAAVTGRPRLRISWPSRAIGAPG
jgi:hypothetical protein